MIDGPSFPQAASAPKEVFERLSEMIAALTNSLGKKPNQSDIARRSQGKGMSRRMVLQALSQGEGTHWKSSLEGRAVVYELLAHCSSIPIPGGKDEQNNRTSKDRHDDLSHCPGGAGLDNGTSGQSAAGEACTSASNSLSAKGGEGLSQQVPQ